MCGIAGVLAADPEASIDLRMLQRMADRLTHRGPDGSGRLCAVPIEGDLLLAIDLSNGGAESDLRVFIW